MPRDQLLKLLEEAVARELQAAIQYMWQHVAWRGPEAMGAELKRIAVEEMRHAEAIAERLVDLGGLPPTSPTPVHVGESPEAMLERDALDEEGAVRLYRRIAEVARGEGDCDTAELIESVMRDEEAHLAAFREMLRRLRRR